MEIKKLPVYKLRISEDDENKLAVNYIALVNNPAIELNWLQFGKQVKFTSDSDRKLIMGPLMVANMPIYRRDEERGEYYVVFDKEEIFKIVQKFFRKGYTSNFNIMHNGVKVDNVYGVSYFFTDKAMGINPPDAFKDISEGSWFGVAKVENEELWNEFIKTGLLQGFSVEGFFDLDKMPDMEHDIIQEIIEIVKGG